jgi:exodeoxyribonuclease-3
MTFNVLFGGGDEARFAQILEIVAAAQPDVLVLEECLGWEDGDRLARVARAAGAAHPVLGHARPRGSGKRYHVALVSKLPVRRVRTHDDAAFVGHCILEAELENGVTVFGAHFDSHGESLRFVEARYLRSITDGKTGLQLLAGDLNSISRRDPYPQDLADKLRAANVDKYGHPPRFEVIDELESAGWVDTLWHRGPPPAWITARRDRGGVHIDYRTDYVFASPALATRLTGAAIVPVGDASDHDALFADFAL